ncbi:MAG: hypothetical protein U9P00_14900 [Pseudomonadota bacterium]|nr:hypothetical protein [Pseudomonadota bacterium]
MTTNISIRIMDFESGSSPASHFLTSLPVLALILVTQPAVSGEFLEAKLNNENNKFHEVHEPEVNVSGNVVVGVMSTSAGDALREDSLGIQSSETGDKKICLKVTSRDGAYMSQNEYLVNVTALTPIYLPYQSDMKKIIGGYEQQGAIAVSATIGDCEHSAKAAFYLPAKLDKGNAKLNTGNLSIYINGFDATDVFYHIAGSDSDQLIDCNYIEEGRHTAYNFSCEITGEQLDEPGPLEIKILREVYGRELVPDMVVRLLPTH